MSAFADLARNLAAGARLVTFRRVSPADFRVSPAAFAMLVSFNLVVLALSGMLRLGTPGTLAPGALPQALFPVPAMLFAALVLATLYRRGDLLLTLGVMWIAGDWLLEIALLAIHFVFEAGEPSLVPRRFAIAIGQLYALWSLVVLWRAIRVAAGPERPRLVYAAGIATLLFLFFYLFVPRAELWRAEPEARIDAPEALSAASEEIFHLQPVLLAESLAALEPERPGVVDHYFVGVAPYSREDVFARELGAVEKLYAERFDTAGRSVALVNSPETLKETPVATVTNLRTTLAQLARIMNPDEDVLTLYLTSHGDSRHEIAFDLPPLDLQQLTPTSLSRMLNDAGIKWKVIIISACYSGGYVEPLRDANSIVITAAAADRTSFGCENGRDWTYFGEAYFREALAATHSFVAAFEAAAERVAERERRDGLEPSRPQIAVGAAIRAKLGALESRLARPR